MSSPSSIRGCREAVQHGETGLLAPPGDAVALTDALRRLLNDPGMAAEMGAAARLRAERFFDIELASERFAAGCLGAPVESGKKVEAELYANS